MFNIPEEIDVFSCSFIRPFLPNHPKTSHKFTSGLAGSDYGDYNGFYVDLIRCIVLKLSGDR